MHSVAPTFEQLAERGDDIDVALGAALIARDVYGALDVPRLLGRFDELALPLLGHGLGTKPAREQAIAVSAHLYGALGFAGNAADYYDARNSLLPDVLERRVGIPISLALVYCEVSKRVGVDARGVSFPGHFLVRVMKNSRLAADADVLVDPFFEGKVLDEDSLAALVARVAGQAASDTSLRPEMLAPATGRAVLSRWLMNLRGIYLSRGDLPRAMLVVDRLVSLSPRDRNLLRDRGMLAARLGAVGAAREDLMRALSMDPTGEGSSELRDALEKLDAKPSKAN
jgi:regulator of sirC expression with transglutaminase-like and TPR domain